MYYKSESLLPSALEMPPDQALWSDNMSSGPGPITSYLCVFEQVT